MRHGPSVSRPSHRAPSNRSTRRPIGRRLALLAASALIGLAATAPATAQQAYFRGEAEPEASVTVDLSVIDRLRGTAPAPAPAPGATAPQTPTPAPPPAQVPRSTLSNETAAATRSGGNTLSAPPATMPQSTLIAPSGSGGTTVAAPPPPSPTPAPSVTAPPPAPSFEEETAAAQPVPAPPPPPPPAPEPVAAPEPEPTPEPAPPEPVATAPEPEPEPEVVVTPPPPPPPPPPTPAPVAEAAEAAQETGEETDDKVASVDLTALDSAGILRRDDGVSILFTKDSQDLPASAEPALAEIAERMRSEDALTLTLLGYSEAIGDSGSKPRRLSLFRALAVRTFLLKEGIDSRRMNVQALGTKDDNPDRPPNRVDLTVSGG